MGAVLLRDPATCSGWIPENAIFFFNYLFGACTRKLGEESEGFFT